MTPTRRKIVYAVSYELIGIAVASASLSLMANADVASSAALSTIAATIALFWSFAFNSIFEAWEARQSVTGRSALRRIVHAVLFEGGFAMLLLPITAWWLDATLLQALGYEIALIAIFMVYTYAFTWAFDLIFGLPASAR